MADNKPLRIRVRDVAGRAVKLRLRYLIPIALGVVVLWDGPSHPLVRHEHPEFLHQLPHHGSVRLVLGAIHPQQVRLHNCHVKPGLLNLALNPIVVSQNIYLNFLGRAEMPEQIGSATNENCLQSRVPHHQPRGVHLR